MLARRVADGVHLIMAGGYDTRVVQHSILLALPIVLLLLLLLLLATSNDSVLYVHRLVALGIF